MSEKNILVKKNEWLSHKYYIRINIPDLTEEKIRNNKIGVRFNAAGFYDKPDSKNSLKDPTWVSLPFTFFEPASDVVVGTINFDAQPGKLQINFGVYSVFEGTTPSSSHFHMTIC